MKRELSHRPGLVRGQLAEARSGSREDAHGRPGLGTPTPICRRLSRVSMDPSLVLLHSVSPGLSSSILTEFSFLCQDRVGKRKLDCLCAELPLPLLCAS